MATVLRDGPRSWELTQDDEGHREYKVVYLVDGASTDGPLTALQTPGLPVPGAVWSIDADLDLWAWRKPSAKVTPLVKNDKNRHFEVELTFSTKPIKRCQDDSVEDPLLQPPAIGGEFGTRSEEATVDRFGFPIRNSAFEVLRGAQVEFDVTYPKITITMNVAVLDLGMLSLFVNRVNKSALWGMPPRTIKLSTFGWDRKFYGLCYAYYQLTLNFDVNINTFDRNLLDEGTKVLNGEWNRTTGVYELKDIAPGVPPNRGDSTHYKKFKDRRGNEGRVVLNGAGLPALAVVSAPPRRIDRPAPYYIARAASSGAGAQPPNASYWVAQDGGDSYWEADVAYLVGNLVVHGANNDTYLATAASTNNEPPSSAWLIMPGDGVKDQGPWDPATSYVLGDRVTVPPIPSVSGGWSQATTAGWVHVERYDEAEMLLLGIPVIL